MTSRHCVFVLTRRTLRSEQQFSEAGVTLSSVGGAAGGGDRRVGGYGVATVLTLFFFFPDTVYLVLDDRMSKPQLNVFLQNRGRLNSCSHSRVPHRTRMHTQFHAPRIHMFSHTPHRSSLPFSGPDIAPPRSQQPRTLRVPNTSTTPWFTRGIPCARNHSHSHSSIVAIAGGCWTRP